MSNTTHPALLKAIEVYDRPGDLTSHQQNFLQSVHRASQACVRIRSNAIQNFGYGSKTAEDIAEQAYAKECEELAAALTAYEKALEDE